MNKNSILGFVIIGVILIVFSWYNSKVFNEQQEVKAKSDSTVIAKNLQAAQNADTANLDTASKQVVQAATVDSTSAEANFSSYKDSMLIKASKAPEEITTLENSKIKIDFLGIFRRIIGEFFPFFFAGVVHHRFRQSRVCFGIFF